MKCFKHFGNMLTFVLQNNLRFPEDDTDVSDIAKDLILCLITTPERRLGQGGIDDFKSHPFFAGIEWDSIRDGNRYCRFVQDNCMLTVANGFNFHSCRIHPRTDNAYCGVVRHYSFSFLTNFDSIVVTQLCVYS
jgi:hypothetical protein